MESSEANGVLLGQIRGPGVTATLIYTLPVTAHALQRECGASWHTKLKILAVRPLQKT